MNTPIEHARAGGRAVWAAAIACAMLVACGGSGGEDAAAVTKAAPTRSMTGATSTTRTPTLTATAAAAPAAATASTEGRLLASNCFQCHGTNGKGPGFDSLAGKSASSIYGDLKEFQSGKEGNGIMARHAMGYTDAQLQALSQWLSTQR